MGLSLRNGDYVPDGTGGLRRTEGREALLEQVLFRLTARRGTFPFLPELGSRLWQLGQLPAARRQSAAEQYAAEALAAEIGGWAVQADVADPVQVGRMVDNVLDKYCQLDILICNAGIAQQKLFGDLTDDDWRRMFAVNVDGVFHAVRAALPHFIHRKAGRIVTVSSMWGQVGASCEVAYSAAKAGLIGLTKAVAKELAPKGITCNAVAPGFIETDMTRDLSGQDNGLLAAIPLGRMGQPQEVAEAVAFLATAPYITGEVLRVDGGIAM